jgi:hypothetical protein
VWDIWEYQIQCFTGGCGTKRFRVHVNIAISAVKILKDTMHSEVWTTLVPSSRMGSSNNKWDTLVQRAIWHQRKSADSIIMYDSIFLRFYWIMQHLFSSFTSIKILVNGLFPGEQVNIYAQFSHPNRLDSAITNCLGKIVWWSDQLLHIIVKTIRLHPQASSSAVTMCRAGWSNVPKMMFLTQPRDTSHLRDLYFKAI